MRIGLDLASGLAALWLLACQPAASPARPAAPAPGSAASQPTGAAAPQSTSRPAASQAPAQPAALQPIKIAIVSPNEAMAVPWIAEESGIFARHGFDAEVLIVGGSPRVTQSLIAGDFDYAIAGSSSFIRARLQGADPTIIASSLNTAGNFHLLTLPQSGVRTLQDLRGKTVGVAQLGSDADVFLRTAVERAGLRPEEVTIIQHGGSPQGAAALLTGQLPAAVVGGSAIQTAIRAGAVSIANGKELQIPGLTGTIATTRRHIERNPAEVQRVVRAYVEGTHFYKTRRDESIAILNKSWAGMPEEEIAFLYDDVVDDMQAFPMPSDESVMAMVQRESDPQTAAQFKPTDFYDPTFLREVERSGLIRELYQ
jgi:ABC-type nitrate/sulfonate/bicarbonate transport system substrate-binding protein